MRKMYKLRQMFKDHGNLVLLMVLFGGLVGCSYDIEQSIVDETSVVGTKGDVGPEGPPIGPPGPPDNNGSVVLGKKLTNPYTPDAMKRAWDQVVKPSGPSGPPGPGGYPGPGGVYKADIVKTHYYIRFLPKNEDELLLLKGFELFPYPLDYELGHGGVTYHDPAVSEDTFTWQYTIIKVGRAIPSVESQLLSELFLMEDGEFIPTKGSAVFSKSFYEQLETKSLELTGNATSTKGIGGPTGPPASSWRPSGKITVYDDYAGEIPLVGAKVRARRWFTIHRGITDSQGKFSVDGTFKRPANYSIIWERDDWDIRNGWYGEALFNGPKQKGEWNLYIESGKSLNFATIHRAAERMLHQDILGLSRKTNPSRLTICHINKAGTGDYWGDVASWILPSIRIFAKNDLPSTIFKTTVHELGHANHCSQVGRLDYWQTRKIIYESWADCIEKYITEDEYTRLLGSEEKALFRLYGEYVWVGGSRIRTMGDLPFLVPNDLNNQSWPYNKIGSLVDFNGIKDFGVIDRSSIAYSPLFIDFIDEDNQRDYYIGVADKYNAQVPMSQQIDIHKNAILIPNDDVRNFTLAEVQAVIHKSYGLASLKTNFVADFPVYKWEIEELFKLHEDYWYRLGM